MKNKHIFALAVTIGGLTLLGGCTKEEPATPGAQSQPQNANMDEMKEDAKNAVDDAAEATKDAMDNATGG